LWAPAPRVPSRPAKEAADGRAGKCCFGILAPEVTGGSANGGANGGVTGGSHAGLVRRGYAAAGGKTGNHGSDKRGFDEGIFHG